MLVTAGCDLTTNTCSARCAQAYEPIARECQRVIIQGSQQAGRGQQGQQGRGRRLQAGGRGQNTNTGGRGQNTNTGGFDSFAFGQACTTTLHPASGDTETNRECHDGTDNDSDGLYDCDDSDCCNFMPCSRQATCVAFFATGQMLPQTNGACGSTQTLPVLLECSHWTAALNAGASMQDLCSSSCRNDLETLWTAGLRERHDDRQPRCAVSSRRTDPKLRLCTFCRLQHQPRRKPDLRRRFCDGNDGLQCNLYMYGSGRLDDGGVRWCSHTQAAGRSSKSPCLGLLEDLMGCGPLTCNGPSERGAAPQTVI